MEWFKKLLGAVRPEKPAQASTVRKEPSGIYVVRLCGVLSKGTQDNIQKLAVAAIEKGAQNLKVLVLLADFRGWRKGDDWGDLEFLAQYGNDIAKLALVGREDTKEAVMLFVLAGQRKSEVRYFDLGQEDAARAWLAT
jgi:hypothetical protein